MILPALDTSKCIGSGDCVAACPTNCLAMAGPLPWLPRPLDCVACAACELVCPTGAMTLPNLGASPPVPVETAAKTAKMRRSK